MKIKILKAARQKLYLTRWGIMTKDFSSKTMVVKRQGNKTSLKICKELPTQNSKSSKNFFQGWRQRYTQNKKKINHQHNCSKKYARMFSRQRGNDTKIKLGPSGMKEEYQKKEISGENNGKLFVSTLKYV